MKARKLKAVKFPDVSGRHNTHTCNRRKWINLVKKILGGKTSKDGRKLEGGQTAG